MTDTDRRIITCLDGLHMALIDTNKILRDLIDPADGRIHGISNMIVMVQEALGPLLEGLPQYQPSLDDKTPTAATGEAEKGTPVFASHSVGDEVEFTTFVNPCLNMTLRGRIQSINSQGMATISAEGDVYARDLCVLKNLSRQP